MTCKMTYEEFERAVYDECLKDATAQHHPKELDKIFEEMKERTKKHYEDGYSVVEVAWGICLLI